MTRRTVLLALASKTDRPVAGGFVNDAFPLGHRLRDRAAFPAAKRRERVPLVIVGGGIAGLAAAWRCVKRGFGDFVLVEMEREAGGNSRSGENEVSRYPWAAHYVPVPNRNSALVRELFEEFGLMSGAEAEERHLCHSPQERLFLHGRWQDGIEPQIAASRKDHEQYRRFDERMREYAASGEFRIPMETARVAKSAALDRGSMAAWMRSNGFDSEYLNWYVDYACRDDYGASAADTSAWAGVHYFAAREHDEKGPFTWPEGNGWLVRKLLDRAGKHVRTGSPVYRIARVGRRWIVRTPEVDYEANGVIFAAPLFLAPYLIEGAPRADGFEYSPWVTSNVTLDRLPAERHSPLAWDNVIYGSPSLGYVDATHQSLASRKDRAVWTHYWALSQSRPADARRQLLADDWPVWRDRILGDLRRAHVDIRDCVTRVDVMRIGHAMVRPRPGFLFGPERRRWLEMKLPNLWFGHSDLSGFSLFEEAQYRGDTAAIRALAALSRP